MKKGVAISLVLIVLLVSISFSAASVSAFGFSDIVKFFENLFGKKVQLSSPTYTLTVTSPSNGCVDSGDGDIKCCSYGPRCSYTYNYGDNVTLYVYPDTGYSFAGWSGDCSGTGTSCTVTMDAGKTASASFTNAPSAPTGLTATAVSSSQINLVWNAVTGVGKYGVYRSTSGQETFLNYAGVPIAYHDTQLSPSTTYYYKVTAVGSGEIESTKSNEASATTPPSTTTYTLTISIPSTQNDGCITSDTGGINCGFTCAGTAKCVATYNSETSVMLTASSAPGYHLSGWGSVCSGTGTSCSITMDADKEATPSFSTASSVNGVCSTTTAHICTAGTASGIADTSTNYVWQCVGSNGGTTASCSLLITPVNGVCGSTNNACTPGTLNDIADNSTHYKWQCVGSNGGTTASCSLVIGTSAFDYSLTVPGVTITSGTVTQTITVTKTSGTAQPVTVQIGTVPAVTIPSHIESCTPTSGSCTVTFSYGADTTYPRTITVAVTGTSSGVADKSTTFNLIVGSGGTPVNGVCGSTNNACTPGTLNDIADNSTHYKWQCVGSNGGTTASCSLAITPSVTYNLSVSLGGNGTGTVNSSDNKIKCLGMCSVLYNSGSAVSLTANAGAGSVFSGWTNCPSAAGSVCTINSLNAGLNITANFIQQPPSSQYYITATPSQVALGGSLTVSWNSPANSWGWIGIYKVGDAISAANLGWWNYTHGATTSSMSVTAPAVAGNYEFHYFPDNGYTSIITSNIVTVGSSINYLLNVSVVGSGTITSSPAGISCGSNSKCSASYGEGASVTLTPGLSGGGYVFTGWSGDCSGTGVCVVAMSSNKSVTATFSYDANARLLTVLKAGTGSGTITSNPAGISCGSICGYNYSDGTTVNLTAVASGHSAFTSWSGCDSRNGNNCIITLDSAATVTASFNKTSSGGSGDGNELGALTISLLFPGNGTTLSSSNVSFKFDIDSEYNVSNRQTAEDITCSLVVDGNELTHLDSASLTSTNEIDYVVGDGSHSYSVSCMDDLNDSGRSMTKYFKVYTLATCSSNWHCDSWGDCTDGEKTRECTDLNSCSGSDNPYPTSQSCETTTSTSTGTSNTWYIVAIVVLVVLIAGAAFAIWWFYGRNKSGAKGGETMKWNKITVRDQGSDAKPGNF